MLLKPALRSIAPLPSTFLDSALDLRFDLGEVDPRITVTRPSGAAYWDAQGILRTAAAGVPRIDFDSATGQCLGLLIEEQRTNLLPYSEKFELWSVAGSISASAVTAPDGSTNARQSVNPANTYSPYDNVTFVAGTAHSRSIFIHDSSTAVWVRWRINTAVASVSAYINLSTKAFGVLDAGFSNPVVTNVGGGWAKYSVTYKPAAGDEGTRNVGLPAPAAGNGSSVVAPGVIVMWGAQVEVGAFSTSYIKTDGAQVTRAADPASMTGANFSGWFNPTEGTIFSEYRTGGKLISGRVLAISRGTSNDLIEIIGADGSGGGAYGSVRVGGSTQAAVPGTTPATQNTISRVALAYRQDDFAGSVNGGAAGIDTSGSIPTVDRMYIGARAATTEFLCGHVRRIAYYPRRLPDSALQALTA